MAMFCITMLILLLLLLGTLIIGFRAPVIILSLSSYQSTIQITIYTNNYYISTYIKLFLLSACGECRGWIDCSKQLKDITVESMQEKAQEAGISHSMVGFPRGYIHKPVLVNFCLKQLGFQVYRSSVFHLFIFYFILNGVKFGDDLFNFAFSAGIGRFHICSYMVKVKN